MLLVLMVINMRRARKSMSIIMDMGEGIVKVMVDGQEAAKADFMFDETQIRVTDVSTEKVYRKCGYGRLLFDALKCVAKQKKMPLLLWSSDMALEIQFYEKLGFLHLNNPEIQRKIIFGNLDTAEEIAEKIDDDDFVWIPQTLNRKPILYL
jgi:GNAT superfamily N-acetyltransferase